MSSHKKAQKAQKIKPNQGLTFINERSLSKDFFVPFVPFCG
jgi:hypothetical protein